MLGSWLRRTRLAMFWSAFGAPPDRTYRLLMGPKFEGESLTLDFCISPISDSLTLNVFLPTKKLFVSVLGDFFQLAP